MNFSRKKCSENNKGRHDLILTRNSDSMTVQDGAYLWNFMVNSVESFANCVFDLTAFFFRVLF